VTPAEKAWRRETRTRLLAERLAVPPETRGAWEKAIERRLALLLAAAPPATIAGYWPIRGEPDLRPLLRRLAGSGWRPALPVLVGAGKPMVFRAWSPECAMSEGLYGIPVPQGTDEVRPDLVLLPLVGFDAARFRLGYGGGYYDRTLAGLAPRPRTIGIGFELARLATVHPQPHDIALDAIVTEATPA
jgi:5-formyltetrahydrofolate cyclo-ligase